jgi:hypothetical protein
VLAALALAALLRSSPALSLSLALAAPGVERWLAPLLPPVDVEELSISVGGRRIVADLYRPPAPRGAILLVHGLSRAGRRHADLVRLARLLARHGTLVVVPQFEGLAAFRLTGAEVDDVDAMLTALAGRGPRLGIAGFSFGAGPALIAAARHPGLVLTASFGGYADLRDVIRYLTTGVDGHGRRDEPPPEPYNRWKLLALLVGLVEDGRDRELLARIAERKLDDPGADTRALETDAGREARAVLALVMNRREDAVDPLLAALPASARAAIEALSPLRVVPRLPGRLVIAHGAGDVSIPFTESLRLAAASNGRAQAVILETFHHTAPLPLWQSLTGHLRDSVRLVRLTDALLSPSP